MALVVGLLLALGLGGVVFYFNDSLAFAALAFELGLLVGSLGWLAAVGRANWRVLRLRRLPRSAFLPSLGLGAALLLGNMGATVLLGPPMQDVEFVVSAGSLAERIILAVSVALIAPVAEEVLFRGLLQGALETRLRHWYAIALTGMAFALLHGSHGALFFFFWSLPVGWVTWRTGSIRPAIVVHAVNNVVGLVGLFATDISEPPASDEGIGVMIFGAILLMASALWAVGLCRRLGVVAESVEAEDGF
jgi:membrane protease YdiL (CAAX protease family)